MSEREGAKTQAVLETLKSLAHRGPAVLVLANTTKSAENYRGRGEIADTFDLLYEARDITGWTPPPGDEWWEHLPSAGDNQWASRASRRRGQTMLRLAFIPSKFRLGIEPEPFCLEIDTSQAPWKLTDITKEIEQAGDVFAQQAQRQTAQRLEAAAEALLEALKALADDEFMLKSDAEHFLRQQSLSQSEARSLLNERYNAEVNPAEGKWRLEKLAHQRGNPIAVTPV